MNELTVLMAAAVVSTFMIVSAVSDVLTGTVDAMFEQITPENTRPDFSAKFIKVGE